MRNLFRRSMFITNNYTLLVRSFSNHINTFQVLVSFYSKGIKPDTVSKGVNKKSKGIQKPQSDVSLGDKQQGKAKNSKGVILGDAPTPGAPLADKHPVDDQRANAKNSKCETLGDKQPDVSCTIDVVNPKSSSENLSTVENPITQELYNKFIDRFRSKYDLKPYFYSEIMRVISSSRSVEAIHEDLQSIARGNLTKVSLITKSDEISRDISMSLKYIHALKIGDNELIDKCGVDKDELRDYVWTLIVNVITLPEGLDQNIFIAKIENFIVRHSKLKLDIADEEVKSNLYTTALNVLISALSTCPLITVDSRNISVKSGIKNTVLVRATKKAHDEFSLVTTMLGINLPFLVKPQVSVDGIIHQSNQNTGHTTVSDDIIKVVVRLSSCKFRINTDLLH